MFKDFIRQELALFPLKRIRQNSERNYVKNILIKTLILVSALYLNACASGTRKPSSNDGLSGQSGFSGISSKFVSVNSQPEFSVANREGLGLYYVPYDTSYSADSVSFQLGALSSDSVPRLAKMVMEEFQLYPTDCLRKVQVDQIVLSNSIGIAFTDGSVDSRSATLDPVNNTMIYSEGIFSLAYMVVDLMRFYQQDLAAYQKLVAMNRSDAGFLTFLAAQKSKIEAEQLKTEASAEKTSAFMINVIHHEFYHFWDTKVNGSPTPDAEWAALNDSSFQYGNGGRFNRNSNNSIWNTNYPGFLDDYARTAVEEDKAEVYGALLAHPVELTARMQNDPILARKVNLLKSRAQRFCSSMNSNFWRSAEQTVAGRVQYGIKIMITDDDSAQSLPIPGKSAIGSYHY